MPKKRPSVLWSDPDYKKMVRIEAIRRGFPSAVKMTEEAARALKRQNKSPFEHIFGPLP